jgi:hypothetical protein
MIRVRYELLNLVLDNPLSLFFTKNDFLFSPFLIPYELGIHFAQALYFCLFTFIFCLTPL